MSEHSVPQAPTVDEIAGRLREALVAIRDHGKTHDQPCHALHRGDCADAMQEIARAALAAVNNDPAAAPVPVSSDQSSVPGPDAPRWTRREIVDLIHEGLPIIEAYDTSIVAPRRFAEEIAAELLARDVDVAVNSDQADTAVSTRRGSELNSDPNRCAKCGCDRASGSTCPTPPCGLDDQGDGDLLGAVANLLDLPDRNDDGVPLSWGDVIRRLQEWRGDIKHRERLRALGAERSRPVLPAEGPERDRLAQAIAKAWHEHEHEGFTSLGDQRPSWEQRMAATRDTLRDNLLGDANVALDALASALTDETTKETDR